jgi:hypothetical protein
MLAAVLAEAAFMRAGIAQQVKMRIEPRRRDARAKAPLIDRDIRLPFS